MKVDKLIGWLLVVVGIAQVFQAIHLQARTPNSPGYPFAMLVALLIVAGTFLLLRAGRSHSKQ